MAIDPRFYELVKHLWRGGRFGYFWSPDVDGQKYSYWVTTDSDLEVPKLFWNVDAYFGVHAVNLRRSEHERAKSADVTETWCLYFEFDCKTEAERHTALARIDALPFRLTALVSSGGGYHGYVALRSPLRGADCKAYQYAMSEFAGGDTNVKDLTRVLRIPGTYNHKPEYAPDLPAVEFIQFDMSIQYEPQELQPWLQPLIDARAARKAHTPHPSQPSGAVSLSDQELLDVLFRSKNGDTYRRLWDGDLSPAGGDHSKADMVLCCGLAWLCGRDTIRMDSLFRQSGLMRDKWNRDTYREDTLREAADTAQTVYDPGYVDPAVAAARAAIGLGTPRARQAAGQTVNPAGRSITDILLDEGPNDEGNAQCLFHLYYGRFLYTDAYGYLFWNGQYWQAENAESELTRAAVDTLQRRAILAIQNTRDALLRATKPNSNNVKNALYLFKSLVDVHVSLFDADPELLNCNNGVVNLRTGQLTPHDSSQLFTYCVPVDYDPGADYVQWVEFLHHVTSRPEVIEYLQTAVGYSVTGYTREECLFYVYGPTRSGKGTFSETLLSILPKPLGVETDFATFTAKREADTQNFDLAPLKPARLIIASESNKYDTLNEAKVKAATGGNWIRCAFKHHDHFEYRPQFKIWLVSNHPVKGDVDDDAFWGRVKVIDFPNSFLGKEDKTLKQRMKDPENLKGVLRWIVEGAVAWFAKAHGLETPQAVTDATAGRRIALDHVQQWLDECCIVDLTAWTSNADIRTSYENWCRVEGHAPKQAEQFGRTLSAKGFATGIYQRSPLGKKMRGVQGLKVL